MPEDEVDCKQLSCRRRTKDKTNGIRHGWFHVIRDTIADSRCSQMLAFKKADLEVQCESLFAYTASPAQCLKSIAASTRRFLDRNAGRTPPPTQLSDAATLPCSPLYADAGGHEVVLDGLRSELDSYLHEPRMPPFKVVPQGPGLGVRVVWCNPLMYWMASIFPHFNSQFSPVCVGC